MKDYAIDHIGIAVRNIEDSVATFRKLLGVMPFHYEVIPDQGVRACFIQLGDQKLELLEPLYETSPIYKFLERRGEGMHHLAYRVENIYKSLEEVAEQGFRLIDAVPRKGALNKLIAFLHPKDTHGVLVELCQPMPAVEEE